MNLCKVSKKDIILLYAFHSEILYYYMHVFLTLFLVSLCRPFFILFIFLSIPISLYCFGNNDLCRSYLFEMKCRGHKGAYSSFEFSIVFISLKRKRCKRLKKHFGRIREAITGPIVSLCVFRSISVSTSDGRRFLAVSIDCKDKGLQSHFAVLGVDPKEYSIH